MAFSLISNISDSELINYYLTINNNICRICLEKSSKLLPIFDPIKPPHFSILIMACASVQVIENDCMPKYICQKCINKLNIAFQFKSQCESSDAKLRQHFEQLNTVAARTDLISYVEFKKESDILYNVTSGQLHDLEQSEIEITASMQSKCLNNQIKQPGARFVLPNVNVRSAGDTVNVKGENADLVVNVPSITKISVDKPSIRTIIEESANVTASENINGDCVSIADKTASAIKQHQCDLCGKIFRTKPSLVHHIRIHTGERPFFCHLCDKRFINGGHLHTHMRTHTGEKNHICPMCPKAFATAQQLTKHTIAIHTTERPYACTYCSKRFASSSNLGTHIKIHTGEKNYHCDKCAKAFATKGQLFQHMLVHTGERAFLCEYCDKRFSQKAHLVRHLKMHRKGT